MKAQWLIHIPYSGSVRRGKLGTKVLEDDSTLFITQNFDFDTMDIPWAPLAELSSIFALQPRKDFINAAKSLALVTNEEGVEVIKKVFPTQGTKSKGTDEDSSHTALLLLVKVSLKFYVKSEKTLPTILRKARKRFVRRRSTAQTMLEAGGFKVTLITGDRIRRVHFQGEHVPEGISVFKGQKGFHSDVINRFLRLDRVPTRQLQEYAAPDLQVTHLVGARIKNPAQPVGFPRLRSGPVLVCGSDKSEVISVIQQLIHSISTTRNSKQIFVIDTQNELNGLIQHLQTHPEGMFPIQVFQLGTNIHLNLCDVIVPSAPSGEKQEPEARAAWKSHLICQILLNSLHTSEYLTARYAVPLESQVRKTAEKNHLFTLRDVSLSFGGMNESHIEENTAGSNMMYADMMAIEAIIGILEQFRSFPEVNYPSFTGHYSNTMVRKNTITFFQFGAQAPLIRRATVGFLLHFLSQTMRRGCVVLTHAPEYLPEQSGYKRERKRGSSSITDAYNTLTTHNILILGSHRLQEIAENLDNFDEIKNTVYLKMTNDRDRKLVVTRHELEIGDLRRPYKQYQSLGIVEGEGLLFREDAPQNIGFHFKLEPSIPIDLKPIQVAETKQRGSETLGLTPLKFELLMKLLKLLVTQACRADEAMALIETTKHGQLSLDHLQSLGLFQAELDGGVTYWVITKKGREYYAKQHEFINQLPAPLMTEDIWRVPQELSRLESFYDISSSHQEQQDTNTKVKNLVGKLLNYTRHLRATSIPWIRIAEYHDLVMIDSLEWQDFRNLFDLAHVMVNNLLLEISQLQKQRTTLEIQDRLQTSSVPPHPQKQDLEDFLPADNFSRLQQISQELGLELYPKTGIVDLYFALHGKRRSLFDELERKKKKLEINKEIE
ncbi:MAG: hypothetical protein ACFFAE_07655 [Candidatus Hodarchaeota archaeon]